MSATRTVTTITTSGSKSELRTAATTWGELKVDLSNADIPTDGMKALLKDSKLTLDVNDATLPQGDFKLFLFPGKVKSGNLELLETYDEDELLAAYARITTRVNNVIAEELGITEILNKKTVGVDPDVVEMQQLQKEIQ